MAEAVIDTSVVEAKLSESTLVENDEELVASQNASLDDIMSKIKVSTFGLKRNYSSIDISADKWLLTMDPKSLEKLSNSPSLADGLDAETEQDLRYLGYCFSNWSNFIPKILLSKVLCSLFYYQKSFVRCNFEHHLIACLLLASKIEEAPRRPRDVINVYNRLKQLHRRRHSSNLNAKLEPLVLDAKYVTLKNNVIKAERRILNTLGFVVHVHHPHKLIYAYLHTLQVIDNKELLQKAWSYMNDGLRTDIFLRYKPETIACSCIYLAARTIENPVPLPKDPYPWYELYDASDRDVKTISEILMRLYQRVKTFRAMKAGCVSN
uniref:Cyclin-like domain-containing protein n=1 Tax=Acrobeloides nanus TaxID=290746 RepID=A0A914E5M7_9BILA